MYANNCYGDFAYVYDLLTDDVEYKKRADYVESVIKKHLSIPCELICDLGCGTGTICNFLSQKGYDCIGIDSSEHMLNVAYQKNTDNKILYLNQDITEFELYGTVDVFLSMLDTVNYITDENSLENMFKLVCNYLNPDGIFIFDINTLYKFENILGCNTFNYETENIFYTWENFYEDGMLEFYLNFFVSENNDENYIRFSETHTQRYYSYEKIKMLAEKNGLKFDGLYSDMSFESPKANDERVFFVFKKC